LIIWPSKILAVHAGLIVVEDSGLLGDGEDQQCGIRIGGSPAYFLWKVNFYSSAMF
jgi:hypothetical protein